MRFDFSAGAKLRCTGYCSTTHHEQARKSVDTGDHTGHLLPAGIKAHAPALLRGHHESDRSPTAEGQEEGHRHHARKLGGRLLHGCLTC